MNPDARLLRTKSLRTRNCAKRVLARAVPGFVVAFLVAPGGTLAQTEPATAAEPAERTDATASAQTVPATADELTETLARIEEQAENGALAVELVEPLTALAERYRQNGEHAFAAAALDRALDIVRINYGLYTLEQVPLLELAIDNERARDNAPAAWDFEQDLLTLVARHPDDLATIPIYRKLADERLRMLQRFIDGELPPEIYLGCYYRSRQTGFGRCAVGSKGMAKKNILVEASGYYDDAIAVLLRNGLYSSEELRELELSQIHATYFNGADTFTVERGTPLTTPRAAHSLSPREEIRRRLGNLADYASERGDTLGEIENLVKIADWDLVYSRNREARDAYESAYQRLVSEDLGQDAIDRIFAPAAPVVLPSFLPNPLDSKETPQSRGHIDVEFEITSFGKSRKVDFLDTSANATRADRRRLGDIISGRRFRPRMENGELADAAEVRLRYYLNE